MARATSERARLNGGGRGLPRECPRCGNHDCATCQARDERDDELGDVIEDVAAELGEIRSLLHELVTIARSRSGFRRVPASEVAAVAPGDEQPDDEQPDDEQPEDDEPEDEDEHQHLTEIRSTAGPGQVADAAPSPAPGREGPSLLLGQLREVEARRAAAQAAQGGDVRRADGAFAMLALDARWGGTGRAPARAPGREQGAAAGACRRRSGAAEGNAARARRGIARGGGGAGDGERGRVTAREDERKEHEP
ncbi:MAG: hypothetical protein IPM35_10160 [Myxococcales bacterium]|nr:hypothetical protein [Myxococcales bacterium]